MLNENPSADDVVLECRITALELMTEHLVRIEQLRWMMEGWNFENPVSQQLSPDDLGFVYADRHWLLKRIGEYRAQLNSNLRAIERRKKRQQEKDKKDGVDEDETDDGDSAGVTEE